MNADIVWQRIFYYDTGFLIYAHKGEQNYLESIETSLKF